MHIEQELDVGCFQASLRRRPVATLTVCALVALGAGFFYPAPAGALPHANDPTNAYWGSIEPGGSGCSGCHTLNNFEGVPSTSYIKASARTYPDMKDANGGVDVTGNLGCTFCHNRGTAASKMRGALIHFNGLRSQHPIGRKFTGPSAYHDTQGEYLSSYGSNTPEEMDCLDCHDESLIAPGGYYMVHADPQANNPMYLKNVSAAGQYDELCRSCHGALAAADWKSKGKDIRVTSHLDGRDVANALSETDGTLLVTSDPEKDGAANVLTNQCAGCHSPHSSGNAMLFVSAYNGGSNCTACHLNGDRYDNYTKHGHGKTDLSTYQYGGITIDLAMPCTDCHVALDISTANLAGTRKKHSEKLAVNGDRGNYKKNFNLSKSINSTDPGTATGNPEWGICISCHDLSTYKAHVSYEGSPRGCQDCHDEHAEGSGSTSNIFMISEKSKKQGYFKVPSVIPTGAEAVFYTTPRFRQDHVTVAPGPFDFYRADGNGSCDNTECHGTSNSATVPGPLSQLMGTSSLNTKHSGGYFPPGYDCESCHNHKDPQGGWGASASCDDCHKSSGYPNLTGIARTHIDTNESLTYHSLHAFSPLVGDCADCHIHNGKTVSPNTGTHADGTVNFGGPRLTAALNYSSSGFPTTDCTSANGCHNAGSNEWRYGLGANACADCHAATGKTLDQGGYPAPNKSSATKHSKHVGNTAYVTGSCDDCHGASASTGGHAGHKNGTAETAATVKLTSYATATKTCVTSCHLANTTNDWTDAGALVCVDCHAGAYIGGGANAPSSGLHTGTPSITGNAHDDSWDADGADGSVVANCVTCHTTTPTNPSANHIDGTFDASIGSLDVSHPKVQLDASVGFVDAATPTCGPTGGAFTTCHGPGGTGNGDAGSWMRRWDTSVANTDGTECANCHGGSPTDAAPTVWTAWTTNAGNLARPNMTGVAGPPGLTAAHATDWDGTNGEKIQTTHNVCKTCHGMNSATDAEATYNVTSMWGGGGNHGNGSIDLNGPSAQINLANNAAPGGAEYNGDDDATLETSDFSCTKACHQGPGNVNHTMGDSGWAIKYGDFGAGTCNGCHGYPPLTAADFAARGVNYPDAKVDTAYGGYAGGGGSAQRARPHRNHGHRGRRLDPVPPVPRQHIAHHDHERAARERRRGISGRHLQRQERRGLLHRRRRTRGGLLRECQLPRRADDAALGRRLDQRRHAVHGLPHRGGRGEPGGSFAVEQRLLRAARPGRLRQPRKPHRGRRFVRRFPGLQRLHAVSRTAGAALRRDGQHGHGCAHRRRLREHLRRHRREHLRRNGLQGDLPQRHQCRDAALGAQVVDHDHGD
jgi:predicted CXXCH cytochrome family protein